MVVIVFTKGYREPEIDYPNGKKKKKESKWFAFLRTDTRLRASTVIKKYAKRRPNEVCFKESKQLLELEKDKSNDFNAQVMATAQIF